MVFVDTSAWFALFVATDPDHHRVVGWQDSTRERLVTSDDCIDETLTLLCQRGERRRALEAGELFFRHGLAHIHFLTQDQILRSWLLFQQRSGAGWSFTDCTSKIVISDFGILTALTMDSHFQQFGIAVVP
jgi:predicted nucleic acid-binding protein